MAAIFDFVAAEGWGESEKFETKEAVVGLK